MLSLSCTSILTTAPQALKSLKPLVILGPLGTGHSFEIGWSHDDDYHWHAATCEHTDLFTDKAVHNWGVEGEITTPATHTETGIRTYTCLNCGATKTESIPANASAHEFSTAWTSDANYHWHQATCGHDVISGSASHTFGETVTVVTPATCTAAGAGTQACTVCGYAKDVTIPALGHSPNADHICTACGLFVPFVGPSGGYVFYDCDYDNDETNDGAGPDGLKSSVCGWRYLEAAPADLRVVGGLPTVDSKLTGYSSAAATIIFGYYKPVADGGNRYVNGTGTHSLSDCTGTDIGTGKTNTERLVTAMGDSHAFATQDATDPIDIYAAKLCNDLTYTVGSVTFDDWFMPSRDEMYQIAVNLYKNNLGGVNAGMYWTSSEMFSPYSSVGNPNNAQTVYVYITYKTNYPRSDAYRVRPIRSFL